MARSTNSEHIRFRYGICLNDSGQCSKNKSKEVQQISIRKEFVCAECGKPLKECPPPKTPFPVIKVVGLILGLLLVGGGTFFLLNGSKGLSLNKTESTLFIGETEILKVEGESEDIVWTSSAPEIAIVDNGSVTAISEGKTVISVVGKEGDKAECIYFVKANQNAVSLKELKFNVEKKSLKVGETDKLELIKNPQDATSTYIWSSSNSKVVTVENGLVTAKTAGNAVVTVSSIEYPDVTASCTYNVLSVNNASSFILDYAEYVGDLKNGKPHGNGVLTFTKSHKIFPSKDYVASPGEYIDGTFRNGKLISGSWHKKDGNQVFVKQ